MRSHCRRDHGGPMPRLASQRRQSLRQRRQKCVQSRNRREQGRPQGHFPCPIRALRYRRRQHQLDGCGQEFGLRGMSESL